jgi:RNA-directed DNA polymerase
MHENRETSGTSRSNQDRDQSEKAKRRTADRHVSEESDCVVIPVNLSNKKGQPSAEIGEGRARTKENIAPSHTRPTQSGERVSQGLGGVRQTARERREERFTALLHHLSVDLLRDRFYLVQPATVDRGLDLVPPASK